LVPTAVQKLVVAHETLARPVEYRGGIAGADSGIHRWPVQLSIKVPCGPEPTAKHALVDGHEMAVSPTPFGSDFSDQDIPHATFGAPARARRTAHITATDEQSRTANGDSARTLANLVT
jgi:hypothetical protein